MILLKISFILFLAFILFFYFKNISIVALKKISFKNFNFFSFSKDIFLPIVFLLILIGRIVDVFDTYNL